MTMPRIPGQERMQLWSRHDLPPKWDGRQVKWSNWGTSGLFVCGTRAAVGPEQCKQCRSLAQQHMSKGTVYPLAGEKVEVDCVRRTRSGREYVSGTTLVPRRPRVVLVALRCPDCGLDTVMDTDSGECWTLDESDYGDQGSTDPRKGQAK